LIVGADGLLYGTTSAGGDDVSTLFRGSDERLYGTTMAGGAAGAGTVYRVQPV
jgi:uncharacterized repeat protein (TIGR03803 family)